jgi:hypothetical protein
LGRCGEVPCSSQSRLITSNKPFVGESFKVAVRPNPSRTSFTFSIESNNDALVNIRILDVQGREVNRLRNIPTNSIVTIGDNLSTGFYLAEIVQDGERRVVKLLKIQYAIPIYKY